MRDQSREERIEQAQELVSYFQRTLEAVGEKWALGLFMAEQWLRIVNEPRPNVEELKLMLRALEAEKDNQGVRWWDLYWRVKVLIEIIEQDGEG